ncbi:MAG: hypothetical protein V7739_14385 [Motiliproteus sp.]
MQEHLQQHCSGGVNAEALAAELNRRLPGKQSSGHRKKALSPQPVLGPKLASVSENVFYNLPIKKVRVISIIATLDH